MVGLPYESAITSITGLVSEWIEDPDKKIEFEFKMRELNFRVAESLLKTQTVPWVDATVKIMYALLAFIRPIGALYLSYRGIEAVDLERLGNSDIANYVNAGLGMSFPGWMLSRHKNKNKEQEEITKRERYKLNVPDYE